MNYITLNNEEKIPQLGFGVYQISKEETAQAVYEAIKIGYRLIDTAIAYDNEEEVGDGIQRAIKEGLVTREELCITTKLFVHNVVNYEEATKAIHASLTRLKLDYIDIFLLHQPYGDIYGAWRALGLAQKEGKIKSLGISNFDSAKMIEFVKMNDVGIPQINQIEINPWYQREEDIVWHQKYNVQVEAWAPFAEGRQGLFTNPILLKIAQKYKKSVAQIVLRWLIQRNSVVLAKSIRPERMKENFEVFDFCLSDEDMKEITSLDQQQSAFFDHHNPEMVEWFMDRIENLQPGAKRW
ncbi:MAG: aldo/keto reductase [Erysipelotrichaceae bacterium]|nr:aldo/keto reductase [Erysipelotrichaceae bacterium]